MRSIRRASKHMVNVLILLLSTGRFMEQWSYIGPENKSQVNNAKKWCELFPFHTEIKTNTEEFRFPNSHSSISKYLYNNYLHLYGFLTVSKLFWRTLSFSVIINEQQGCFSFQQGWGWDRYQSNNWFQLILGWPKFLKNVVLNATAQELASSIHINANMLDAVWIVSMVISIWWMDG